MPKPAIYKSVVFMQWTLKHSWMPDRPQKRTTAKAGWSTFNSRVLVISLLMELTIGNENHSLPVFGLVPAATLLKITTRLVDDRDYRFSYILWHLDCKGALVKAWKLLCCNFVALHHRNISACGIERKLSKMVSSWEFAVHCGVGGCIDFEQQ